jgi:hypothetical protein
VKEAIPYLVKITSEIRLEPRARQVVLGKLELPKRQGHPELVCVEPAQIPVEGIYAARTLPRVITGANDRAKQQQGENAMSAISCPRGRKSAVVHVMLENSRERVIVLPKGTVIGVAEETSESLVASLNDGTDFELQLKSKGRKKDRSRQSTAKSKKFAKEKLAHLTHKERSVIKPDCLVEHRPGINIPHVDALSRRASGNSGRNYHQRQGC